MGERLLREHNMKKVRFACRRGMLELDMLLSKFCDERFIHLSQSNQAAFSDLLSLPDPDLYALLFERKLCEDTRLIPVLKQLHEVLKGGV